LLLIRLLLGLLSSLLLLFAVVAARLTLPPVSCDAWKGDSGRQSINCGLRAERRREYCDAILLEPRLENLGHDVQCACLNHPGTNILIASNANVDDALEGERVAERRGPVNIDRASCAWPIQSPQVVHR
jgi:hypothetical protein